MLWLQFAFVATVISLTYRASKKRFPIAWDSLAILGVYGLGVWTVFLMR